MCTLKRLCIANKTWTQISDITKMIKNKKFNKMSIEMNLDLSYGYWLQPVWFWLRIQLYKYKTAHGHNVSPTNRLFVACGGERDLCTQKSHLISALVDERAVHISNIAFNLRFRLSTRIICSFWFSRGKLLNITKPLHTYRFTVFHSCAPGPVCLCPFLCVCTR